MHCMRFLDLPKQVKQKDMKLMSTFSCDCTTFCSYLPDRESFIKTFFSVVVSTLDWLVLLEKDHYCHIISCFPVRCIEMFIFCSACRCTLKFKRVIMSFDTCRRTNKYMFLFFLSFHLSTSDKIYQKCFFFLFTL